MGNLVLSVDGDALKLRTTGGAEGTGGGVEKAESNLSNEGGSDLRGSGGWRATALNPSNGISAYWDERFVGVWDRGLARAILDPAMGPVV